MLPSLSPEPRPVLALVLTLALLSHVTGVLFTFLLSPPCGRCALDLIPRTARNFPRYFHLFLGRCRRKNMTITREILNSGYGTSTLASLLFFPHKNDNTEIRQKIPILPLMFCGAVVA